MIKGEDLLVTMALAASVSAVVSAIFNGDTREAIGWGVSAMWICMYYLKGKLW